MEKWQNLYCSGFLYFIFNSNKKLECFEIDVFLGAEKKKKEEEEEREKRKGGGCETGPQSSFSFQLKRLQFNYNSTATKNHK
jgi:hypothetical protein